VLGAAVLDELVLAVVADSAGIALVWLLVVVPALVVIAVANGRETAVALLEVALVGLLPGVDANVNQQVAPLVEGLLADFAFVMVIAKICAELHAQILTPFFGARSEGNVRGDVVLELFGLLDVGALLTEGAAEGTDHGTRAQLLDQDYIGVEDLKKLVLNGLTFSCVDQIEDPVSVC